VAQEADGEFPAGEEVVVGERWVFCEKVSNGVAGTEESEDGLGCNASSWITGCPWQMAGSIIMRFMGRG
jgi:hypothetical protein